MTLVVNGTESVHLSGVEPHDWNGTEDRIIYLGRSSTNFLRGVLDEVKIYDISIVDVDLPAIWQQAAFSYASMKEHLKIYYPMNDDTDDGKLYHIILVLVCIYLIFMLPSVCF